MWHPHLKRDWIDNKNFKIINSRKIIDPKFQIFLQIESETKEKNFLSNQVIKPLDKKMKCNCKFIKEISNNRQENNLGVNFILRQNQDEKKINNMINYHIKKNDIKKVNDPKETYETNSIINGNYKLQDLNLIQKNNY